MTKIDSVEKMAKTILDSGILSADEFNALADKAKSQEEIELYVQIYNYLLGKRQREVIANESY